MSVPQQVPAAPGRWKRPVFALIVVAAFALVALVWFHTPTAQMRSDTAESGYTTLRCANGGPSRWEPPTVSEGQSFASGQNMESTNLQILKFDIESLRLDSACAMARDTHTNTLIVTTFAAGAMLFFGYVTLGRRRADEGRPVRTY